MTSMRLSTSALALSCVSAMRMRVFGGGSLGLLFGMLFVRGDFKHYQSYNQTRYPPIPHQHYHPRNAGPLGNDAKFKN